MGWPRLVGSLRLQVSFAKEPYKKRLHIAKETYNFKEPTNCSQCILAEGVLLAVELLSTSSRVYLAMLREGTNE